MGAANAGYSTQELFHDISAVEDETSVEFYLNMVLPRIRSLARKAADTTGTYQNRVRPGVRGYDDVVSELIIAAMDAYSRYNPFMGASFLTWSWKFLINRLHELVNEDKTLVISLEDNLCATIFGEEYLTLADMLVSEDDLCERVQSTDNAIQFLKLLDDGTAKGKRRLKVLTGLSQGLNQQEISDAVHVNQSTVSRDIIYIREQAKEYAETCKHANWITYIHLQATQAGGTCKTTSGN